MRFTKELRALVDVVSQLCAYPLREFLLLRELIEPFPGHPRLPGALRMLQM